MCSEPPRACAEHAPRRQVLDSTADMGGGEQERHIRIHVYNVYVCALRVCTSRERWVAYFPKSKEFARLFILRRHRLTAPPALFLPHDSLK